jgi:glyoxylase-like metal-dependent hydrolase (beta-lactamase superfamily II)
MNNPVIAIGDDSVVVIDPGSSLYTGRMVIRQILKLTDKPVSHVIGTHIHGDHWLGNQAFMETYPKAKFLAHPLMIQMAHDGEAQNWLDTLMTMTDSATEGTKAVIPDQALRDGQTISVPGLTIEVLLSETAHTKTDAMLHFVEDSVVVLGDNSLYERIGRLDDGQFKGNITALNRAIEIGAAWYVPGHGKTADVKAASMYRDYLDTIYQAAVLYSEDMLAAYEIKEKIADQFKDYENWSGFETEFGKHISLAVLEAEEDSF